MRITDILKRRGYLSAPPNEGANGGGNDTQAGGGGSDTLAGGGGSDTLAGGGGSEKWFDRPNLFSPEERQWITARGLEVEDVTEVLPKLVRGHRSAEQRLGRGVDTIIDRPKDGQDIGEWRRQNAAVFDVPEKPDGYVIERPADLPDSIAWNAQLEAGLRDLAHKRGWSQGDVKEIAGFYAEHVKGLAGAADGEYQAANQAMMSELSAEWGRQTDAKMASARQALTVVGEAAGLDRAAIEAATTAIAAKTGDAATIRLFAHLADMMAEDKLVAGGSSSEFMTPAEAKAKAAQMRSPDGDYYKATAKNDTRELARLQPIIERLDKIAAGR